MSMSTEQMRAQMQELLGASPIPDASLAQYATMVAGLSGIIGAAAKDLHPEDDAAGFQTFLDSFAEGESDAS